MLKSLKNKLDNGIKPVDRLHLHLKKDMERVNEIILTRLGSDVALIPEVAAYLVDSGGKRLRPLLTLAFVRLVNYAGGEVPELAGAVEFIHTATLLHDDVVDESPLRRGKDAANRVYGNKTAILVGDFLFSRAFQMMVTARSVDVLRVLSDASAVIAEGEVMQLATERNIDTSEDDYNRVIAAKTAALFAAACEVGIVASMADEALCRAARDYGYYLGMAFQIVDDVLDYSAQQAVLGKKIGDDFNEGKMTLPVIRAIAHAEGADKEFWQRTIGDGIRTEGDFDRALALITAADGIGYSVARARAYSDRAVTALDVFPDGDLKDTLAATAQTLVNRAF